MIILPVLKLCFLRKTIHDIQLFFIKSRSRLTISRSRLYKGHRLPLLWKSRVLFDYSYCGHTENFVLHWIGLYDFLVTNAALLLRDHSQCRDLHVLLLGIRSSHTQLPSTSQLWLLDHCYFYMLSARQFLVNIHQYSHGCICRNFSVCHYHPNASNG